MAGPVPTPELEQQNPVQLMSCSPAPSISRRAVMDSFSAILNTDFCPWANRWVYWLKHPLWILVLALAASLACGWIVNAGVFLLSAALLVVIGLGIGWPWIALRGIRCSVTFGSSRGREGEAVEVRLVVTNRRPWPVWGVSVARGFQSDADPHTGVALARIGGWAQTEFTWQFRPQQRGVYPLQPPQVETSFPFGLYRAARPLESCERLIVWPQSVSLGMLPDSVELKPRDDRGSDRRAGDFGDMLGTRAFRDGDSLRRVHWAQTARHGRLIVCERQAPASCALRLVVDVAWESHSGAGAVSTLEQTLRVAASICESLHRQHAHVECLIGSERLSIGSSSRDLRRCLDALAEVPAGGVAATTTGLSLQIASRGLPQVTVTTAAALRQDARHGQAAFGQRIIVIDEAEQHRGSVPASAAGSVVRPWIELPADQPIADFFPVLWRRACHAA